MKTEHEEQCEFVMWYRQTYKGSIIFAIPNGGYRGKAAAGRLKAEGVLSGVPDLFIPELGMFIEMKREKGGSVSPEQRIIMDELLKIGYACEVCKGCEAAKAAVIKRVGNIPIQY